MSTSSQTISCPGSVTFYDDNGTGNYTNSKDYTLTVTAATAGQCLSVTFSAFGTESCCDNLKIYDGVGTGGTLFGTYAGSSIPPTATASAGSLTFVWHSDGSTRDIGWVATISCAVCPPWNGNIKNGTENITCPGPVNFYDDGGSGGNYSASKDYTFTATSSTAGQCLSIIFSAFATESCCDNLKVYDGVGTGGTLLGTYAGTTIPPTLTSSAGSLTFVWHSDGSTQNTGWAATISCTATCAAPPPPSTNMNNTPISLTCPASYIFYDSGGNSATYSASESYTKTFTASAGSCVSYTFNAFNTESTYDYLYIYDGPTTASPLIGSYSGTSLPPSFIASGTSLTFKFTSDGSTQNAGWTATVSCANGCSGAPSAGTAVSSATSGCGSYTTNLSLTGSTTGCGITYQWYQSNASAGTYTAIGTTTSTSTQSFAVTSTTYFKCVTICGASSATTAVITASIGALPYGTGTYSVSLPYSITGQTTCGMVNDFTPGNITNICGSSSYYTDKDVVYVFTPTVTAAFNGSVTSSGSYMGMMLYQGCPTSTGVCIANAQGSSGNQSITNCSNILTAGVTYYLILDSWGASSGCNPYNINLSQSVCSGVPVAGTAVASPSANCGTFTSTLSLSGNSTGCGTTFQWYQSNAAAGTYSAIGSAITTSSITYVITAPTYFKCVVTCGASSATTAVISTTINTISGTGTYSVSLPYTSGAQTTCGMVNDFTSSNVTNICGSSSYYTGEDVVYMFTPSVSATFNSTVTTSSGSYIGMMLYDGCPTAGSNCIANSQSSSGPWGINTSSGCSLTTLNAGQTYFLIIDSWASPTCNPYNLTMSITPVATTPCNMAYTPASTTYSFETFSGTVLPTTDDILFTDYIDFGFSICFDGKPYTGGYVASNSSFVFDAVPCWPNISSSTNASGGAYTGYSISGAAPINGTSVPRNAILAPWHDINPGSSAVVATTKIQYLITGTSPNRKVVISWEDIPMFSGACEGIAASLASSQVKLYEFDSSIEIHIKNKQVCATWNGGDAILGLHNYNGTKYIPPVAGNFVSYNYPTNWTMTTTAYKFTTLCAGSGSLCLNILPVGFTSFNGDKIENVNTLFWQTSSEENMNYYVIERSIDGVNFSDIGQVAAENIPSTYTYKDYESVTGMINYYRIRAVEKNLKSNQTNIISIGASEDETLSSWPIFPNPTNTSEVFVRLNSKKTGTANFIIYDVLGNIVLNSEKNIEPGVKVYDINISKIPNDIFFVTDWKFIIPVNNNIIYMSFDFSAYR